MTTTRTRQIRADQVTTADTLAPGGQPLHRPVDHVDTTTNVHGQIILRTGGYTSLVAPDHMVEVVDTRPSLAELTSKAMNSSHTDPTWRTDYRQA